METFILQLMSFGRAAAPAMRCISSIVPTLRRRQILRGSRCFVLPQILLAFLSVCFSASAQIQQAWVAKYNNGVPNGNHQALKMALDSTGNIFVLGVSANANTNTGYVVMKYAPSGNQLWAARYDSTNFPAATPTGFALDSSNNVVVTGSAVTVKYDSTGNLLWTDPYDGQAIAIDNSQNTYITGVSGNFTTVKLASSGSNVWTTTSTFDGSANAAQAIAVDSSNNAYVAGSETVVEPRQNSTMFGLVKYDSNGNEIWTTGYGGGSIDTPQIVGLAADRNGFIDVELNFLASIGNQGAYQTFKYASDGTIQWQSANPTGKVTSLATCLTLDSLGDPVVSGKYGYSIALKNSSFGTYMLDTNANVLWSALYPTDSSQANSARSLAVDSLNNIYVAGDSTNAATASDIVTLKYDSHGNQLWLERYDGPGNGNDAGNAIAVDNSGNVYVAGYETETNGFTSMILIKYSPVTLQKQPSGNVILHAYGSPGESFDLQASTNLQTWQDLGDIIADTNGLAQFDDTNAPLFPFRFYYTIPQ